MVAKHNATTKLVKKVIKIGPGTFLLYCPAQSTGNAPLYTVMMQMKCFTSPTTGKSRGLIKTFNKPVACVPPSLRGLCKSVPSYPFRVPTRFRFPFPFPGLVAPPLGKRRNLRHLSGKRGSLVVATPRGVLCLGKSWFPLDSCCCNQVAGITQLRLESHDWNTPCWNGIDFLAEIWTQQNPPHVHGFCNTQSQR